MYLLDSDHLSIMQRQRGPEFEALADMTEAVKALIHELETDDPTITQRVERSGGRCWSNKQQRDLAKAAESAATIDHP
jgi:hypothetical protein